MSLAVRRSWTDVCADGWWRICGARHNITRHDDVADGNDVATDENGTATDGNDVTANWNNTTANGNNARADGNFIGADVACDAVSMVRRADAQDTTRCVPAHEVE